MDASESLEVRQYNAITTARYDYTACQLDLLFFLLSKLRREDKPNQEYQIHMNEVVAVTGREWHYQQLREATESMGSRMFEVENDQSYVQLWMFQKVEYVKGQGYLRIRLSEDIRPYLFELKSNFTSYQLFSALKISSKYAKRIYHLASQWKDIGETKTYDLDEFKLMLKLKDPKGKEPEQFQRISDLKSKVLDIAVRQINENTELKIGYTLLKQGRSFHAVRFYVTKQEPKQLPIPFEESPEQAKLLMARRHLESLDIKDPKLVSQIVGDENLVNELFQFMYRLKTDKSKANKNPAGLLLAVLGLKTATKNS
ncbi:replication initiation protein [Hymenobacter sp. HSC-4F20]|uniref:replication initiation protein n=1 Tax=Hymenobacter sp. HSC-4F20 TaxID=2864135 RepID=UPI001C7371B0|nr:replication initiation protein [Hymenobacter sp. HSC-4F20]MBX0293110.1 replication initiation protein [Hymenobacter sp. HSC-4F20]